MRTVWPVVVFSFLLPVSLSLAQDDAGISLPDDGPIPQDSPEADREEDDADDPAGQELPDEAVAPLPVPRPSDRADDEEPERPARIGAMPADERACRARLRELGVVFAEHPPQSEPAGCEMPHPLSVSSLGGGVALEPEGVMNCAIAEANARFMRDHAQREAERHLSTRIEAVNQVSAYVCRPRSGSGRLSEHAFGNALDWGAILFENGERLDVRLHRRGSPEALFLAALRRHGCGPFKTVLGPGSDADHADHLHFDLAERRNGSTYCR